MSQATIRPAQIADVPRVYDLIHELAVFELAPNEHTCTQAQLLHDGFEPNAQYGCLVAELDQEIVGMALYYNRYSTWKGRCLYLEDLMVTPKHQGKGIGMALFEATRTIARTQGYAGMQWQVLNWNEPAISFYKKLGATIDTTWHNGKLTQNQL